MKKLSQLFRMISDGFIVEDQQEQVPFQRVQPGAGNCPEDACLQNNSRYITAEPAADAARKLWRRAQHF